MSNNINSASNNLILTTISLDEPTQLLTILFDVSSSWYTQLNTHIPLEHRPYQRQILSQLYFDTISQICIFINTLLALNKRNLIHFIAINDDRSIVLQQALAYPTAPTINNQDQSVDSNTTTNTKSSLLFPNINWVNPDNLPRPTQANDQLFGTTTSDLFSKLVLLNPFQKPLEDYITEQQENMKRTTDSSNQNHTTTTNSTTSNITNPPPNSFGRLLTGALTKALCYINKAKKYDQSIAPRILIFSLSQFQPTSAYMNCALVAAKFNCLIDTLCINHGFNNYELQQEEFKDSKYRLSNLLMPVIQQTIVQNKSSSTTTSTTSTTSDITTKALEMIKPPRTLPTLSCHCEPHQQSSHITNGCSLFISNNDMNTLIQLYTITYSPLSTLNQQSSIPSTTMSDATTIPLPPTSLDELYMKPQEYLYLLTLLQTHCLSSESIRHHLITPIQTSVTLTSPCFCHPTTLGSSSSSTPTSQQQQINAIQHSTLQKTQPPRYLCNVCLVVVCQQFAQCPNCKSRFVMQKSAIQLNRNTANNTTTNTQSTTNNNTTTAQTTQQPSSSSTTTTTTTASSTTTTQPTTTVKIGLPKPQQANMKPGKININIGKK